jgi:hypothetical protein
MEPEEGAMTADVIASNYLPISYVYAARYGEGRVSLPVLHSQALYASFQHVSGVPAQAGVAAYSVDKLHILEVLIGRLQRVKTDPLAARQAPPDLEPGRIDALIEQYSAELHSLANAPALPYAPRAAEPGMLFSLAA